MFKTFFFEQLDYDFVKTQKGTKVTKLLKH